MDEYIFNSSPHLIVSGLMKLGITNYSQAINVAKALTYEGEKRFINNDFRDCEKSETQVDNSLIVSNGRYFISIKKVSLAILCFLLDAKIESGGLLTLLSTLGLLAPGVQKLSDYEGERCIIVEILKNKSKLGSSSLLDKYLHFCNKPYMNCKFKQFNNAHLSCSCSHKDINSILQRLNHSNILVQTQEGFKYIPQ